MSVPVYDVCQEKMPLTDMYGLLSRYEAGMEGLRILIEMEEEILTAPVSVSMGGIHSSDVWRME